MMDDDWLTHEVARIERLTDVYCSGIRGMQQVEAEIGGFSISDDSPMFVKDAYFGAAFHVLRRELVMKGLAERLIGDKCEFRIASYIGKPSHVEILNIFGDRKDEVA